jgi:Ser/Thr protein kinase RdoA (MazF antagonist)
MNTSKNRPLWNDLPASVRADIEQLIGGPVVQTQTCPGGFSPGFASRLTRTDGRGVFVKAMHADTWPLEAVQHRTEARIAAALPSTIPAPKFLGMFDDRHWTVLAFEDINGTQPRQPWDRTDLNRVAAAVIQLTQAVTPSPIALPRDHPRLGGWAELARDQPCLTQLPEHSAWAADNMPRLIQLEEEGVVAAEGDSLVHFDLYPHNILLTPDGVAFVDWPHARLGAPIVDLLIVLSSAAADGINPEPVLRNYAANAELDQPEAVDAILAAHAGFLLHGALSPTPPGLEAIAAAKLHLGLGSLNWLQQRLANRA